ncbi:HAL/PAL/TAL family ammonia-lyase [Moheibacter lacus]|uniref:Aromatic amino acid lyase n=1 Tax=Moheibacter lacus TaxID=2745851 RepID=A0A838ZLX1_9FLAO|nr:aromatic amino acid ammonia-lyase [Moheibacter lacus]MBA5628760.1 aromatic amino acid lyase [Moheibacter lacus]
MIQIKGSVTLDDFKKVVIDNEEIELSENLIKKVHESFDFLTHFAENKIIYGVNTGFGPMAQYRIEDQDRIQLQYNLIRSHASGLGEILPEAYVKSSMLARLNTLSLGHSGIHISAIELMKELINRNIIPVIYQHGGVGASGDLVQLAHLALILIGEGEVFYKGERKSTSEVFELENLKPLQIHLREGLALMNGTSVMSGIGIINIIKAEKLLDWAISCSSLINEIMGAYDDHLSEKLNSTKKHSGQQKIAAKMRDFMFGSQMIRKRSEHLYNGKVQEEIFKDKLQEYYSIRCVPQILGPIYECLENAKKILVEEVNSANDNPIVDVETQNVYHGGNFHGDYVSFEMDKLRIAVTKLSMLQERQLNYLLNPDLNEMLPAFVNLGKLGLNFGMQGAQFTATSTTAENQTLATSMYIHSIPNNKDNQDVVSMGTNAALLTKKVTENAFEVISIQLLTLVQAIDYLDCFEKLSPKGKEIYTDIRKIVPTFKEDIVLSPEIQKIKLFIMQ